MLRLKIPLSNIEIGNPDANADWLIDGHEILDSANKQQRTKIYSGIRNEKKSNLKLVTYACAAGVRIRISIGR